MDTLSAFAMGQANRGKESKVFDWDRAAEILRSKGVMNAEAGLEGDMEYTGGSILREGKPTPADDTYVFLSSTWATPILVFDRTELECWRMESETPGWNADTYWPESARKILSGDAL